MKKIKKIPLLITSCVVSNAPLTVLNDKNERLQSTLNALMQLADKYSDIPIVICDGSGYDFKNEKEKLCQNFKQIEFLSFLNDSELVKKLGKGYGEGQIIAYALDHSEILKDYDSFAKCTSKLWPENYDKCIFNFHGQSAFLLAPFFSPDKVDTRFYLIKKDFYKKYFLNAHEKVNDLQGYHLEHAFFDVIKTMSYKDVIGKIAPEVYGHSGSVGIHFKPSKVKNLLKGLKATILIAWNAKV